MTEPIVSNDPQALVRQAMAMIKKYPEHWNYRFWHSGTSHGFFGFVELIHHGVSHPKDYNSPSLGTTTMAVVSELLGITTHVAADWCFREQVPGTLSRFEQLFCDDLETLAIDQYKAEELLVVACRPDLTPQIVDTLIELANGSESRIHMMRALANNKVVPLEKLMAIISICSFSTLVLIYGHLKARTDISLSLLREALDANELLSDSDRNIIFTRIQDLLECHKHS